MARKPKVTDEDRIDLMGQYNPNRNKGTRSVKKLIKDNDPVIENTWKMTVHSRSVIINDEDEMDVEIEKFIVYCASNGITPTLSGLSLWLGVTRQTLMNWKRNSTHELNRAVSRFTELFHSIVEQKTLDGELNPLVYFFLGKNYFDLQDKTEVVHSMQTTEVIDISEQQRILETTPGVVIDADYQVVNTKDSDTQKTMKISEDYSLEDLGTENKKDYQPEDYQKISEDYQKNFRRLSD